MGRIKTRNNDEEMVFFFALTRTMEDLAAQLMNHAHVIATSHAMKFNLIFSTCKDLSYVHEFYYPIVTNLLH